MRRGNSGCLETTLAMGTEIRATVRFAPAWPGRQATSKHDYACICVELTWLGIGDARGHFAEKHIRRSTLSRFKGLTKGEGTPELLHVLHMPHATSPTRRLYNVYHAPQS
jgi:hypothetical protein